MSAFAAPLELLLPLLAVLTALALGPSILLSRGVLRAGFGPQTARARAQGLSLGLGIGVTLAIVATGVMFGPGAATVTAVLFMLALLAAMDLLWRWLPLEWTLPLLVLGLASAVLTGDIASAAMGAALGGGLLLALRLTFQLLRGFEALGLGDVWLAAGLGAFVGAATISWLLGAAALLGLALHTAMPAPQSRRFGVAFGAHLCAAGAIFLYF
ncbi:MAG: prepilin peptidase [Pseudomonadota bacterium]